MAITSNIKRIDINFTPLRTSGSIEVVGSVPRRQIWSADTGEFTPDYTLTPLVLFPRITATDPDRYTPSGVVNARLTNMKWYEVQGTIRRLIEPGNARYEVVQDGDAKGRIRVKCNSSVITPLGLEFYAEYIDTRTGQVYVFRLSTVIPVSDATIPAPVLTLDSPATVVWNPTAAAFATHPYCTSPCGRPRHHRLHPCALLLVPTARHRGGGSHYRREWG